MAWNNLSDSIWSTLSSEGSLFPAIGNGYLIETCADKNFDGFGDCKNFNGGSENFDDCQREKTEKVSDDIIDLLPSDPFGMDLSTTFTEVTGWFEDWENDLTLTSLSLGTGQVEVEGWEDRFFAELNLLCNEVVELQEEVNNSKIQEASIDSDNDLRDWPCDGLVLDDGVKEFIGFSYDKYVVSSNVAHEFQGCTETHSDQAGGAPHDAWPFVLFYLGVRDLLSVERVCKSLRDVVQNNALLWSTIHISHGLSEKTTDDALLKLTSRAQGILQCLSLVDCYRITDSGLRHVLESNPLLTKLSVPGCVRLSVEGILCHLRACKSAGKLSIKHLRIGGLSGTTNKQFEELKVLLGVDNRRPPSAYKPRFLRGGQLYLSCDDDRAIDIEVCPKCENPRLVFDCPAESCKGEDKSAQLCRACRVCVRRCIDCGCCFDNFDYEELFVLDLICLDCWKQLLNYQNGHEEMGLTPSAPLSISRQVTHVYLFG